MAFDQATRNSLQKFVSDARTLLSDEFTQQLQNTYGLDPITGGVAELSSLPSLSPNEQQTATLLRDTLEHYLAASHKADPHEDKALVKSTLDRIVREQAFTVLNRLAALRMAEARQFVMESISQGYQSKGFQLYQRIAGSSLGETGQAYQHYLFSVFDEMSLDLAVLFDRYSSQGRLFPRETVLLELLDLINHAELEILWGEDETVGWIYQYFNSKEERKKMRDESQAPRNSRELAVRNQFFTPRYVVEFLTDNTLGRIWYEMTQGNTALIDSCQYLVRRPNEIFLKAGEQQPEQDGQDTTELNQAALLQQTVYIQHRTIKDPRDIKMLDPACGSMHFGLYAFDLFEQIYTEAWNIEEEKSCEVVFGEEGVAQRVALHELYKSKASFLADVPRLIIEHNINGVDIDPRAVQIAGLSLWLRAQKSWSDNAIKPSQRPQITRSNIVCAEPMPGETQLLKEFTSQIQPRVLGQLVEEIFDKMKLAGEAGTLLKIEEEIQTAIEDAKSQNDGTGFEIQGSLFGNKKWEVPEGKRYYSIDDVGNDFWGQAEHLILSQLELYAEGASGQGSGQKRLFSADTAKGFAFIDLCRKRFDVVLMNPPFGKSSIKASKYLESNYSESKLDIYAAFIVRAIGMAPNGLTGAITSRTGFFLSSLSEWRDLLLRKASFETVLDLGYGVLDAAMVSTAAYVIRNSRSPGMCSVIPMLDLDVDERERRIGNASTLTENYRRLKLVDFSRFSSIDGSPFCYWMQDRAIELFKAGSNFKGGGRDVRVGLQTGDNFRFLRLYWEAPHNGKSEAWVPYAKGGDYSPFYRDIELMIEWNNSGEIVKTLAKELYGSETRTIKSQDKYFKKGLTFTIYTVLGFNIRPLPENCIFDVAGSSVFYEEDDEDTLLYILGFMSSPIFQYFISALSDDRKWQVGLLQSVPWLEPDISTKKLVAKNSLRAHELSRCLREFEETDRAFIGFYNPEENFTEFHKKTISRYSKIDHELDVIWKNNTKLISEMYSLNVNDLHRKAVFDKKDQNYLDYKSARTEYSIASFYLKYLSWCVGVVFGRWALSPSEKYSKGPFASLVSPSVLVENINSEVSVMTAESLGFAVSEIARGLNNFESFESDLMAECGFKDYKSVFYYPKYFFSYHLSEYTKSRRTAPVYWALQTPSCSFTLWIYYHKLNQQTLFECINNYIEGPSGELTVCVNRVSYLRRISARSSLEEVELANLLSYEFELVEFRDELLEVAKTWRPNFEDGVQICAAPLWNFFQHKPWRNKLKKTYLELVQGGYDWSKMAYQYWPDRVLRKCHQDRSLAVTHGVEEDLWEEVEISKFRGAGEKLIWQPKEISKSELEAYIENKIAQG
jgi:hypothetical protein